MLILSGEMERRWWVIDLKDKVLGRVATNIATLLMGKYRVKEYLPYKDNGDFVICINAEKIKVTGKKEESKFYKRYSGYPSGLKFIRLDRMRKEHPERIIYYAVKGMLPKNKLRKRRLKRLKIYKGEKHPHQAQKPVKIEEKIWK